MSECSLVSKIERDDDGDGDEAEEEQRSRGGAP